MFVFVFCMWLGVVFGVVYKKIIIKKEREREEKKIDLLVMVVWRFGEG